MGRDLSVNALKVLRLMQRNSYSGVGRVRISPDLHAELQATTQAHITHILEADLRAAAEAAGLQPLFHNVYPPTDAGLAFGQAMFATRTR